MPLPQPNYPSRPKVPGTNPRHRTSDLIISHYLQKMRESEVFSNPNFIQDHLSEEALNPPEAPLMVAGELDQNKTSEPTAEREKRDAPNHPPTRENGSHQSGSAHAPFETTSSLAHRLVVLYLSRIMDIQRQALAPLAGPREALDLATRDEIQDVLNTTFKGLARRTQRVRRAVDELTEVVHLTDQEVVIKRAYLTNLLGEYRRIAAINEAQESALLALRLSDATHRSAMEDLQSQVEDLERAVKNRLPEAETYREGINQAYRFLHGQIQNLSRSLEEIENKPLAAFRKLAIPETMRQLQAGQQELLTPVLTLSRLFGRALTKTSNVMAYAKFRFENMEGKHSVLASQVSRTLRRFNVTQNRNTAVLEQTLDAQADLAEKVEELAAAFMGSAPKRPSLRPRPEGMDPTPLILASRV